MIQMSLLGKPSMPLVGEKSSSGYLQCRDLLLGKNPLFLEHSSTKDGFWDKEEHKEQKGTVRQTVIRCSSLSGESHIPKYPKLKFKMLKEQGFCATCCLNNLMKSLALPSNSSSSSKSWFLRHSPTWGAPNTPS